MATEELKKASSESLGFKEREKIENPAELLQNSISGLDKVGGFQLLKGLIKGVENMDPRRKAVKNIFLSDSAYAEARKRITTGVLNDLLNDAMTRVQPPSDKGKRLKIYYMTQVSANPPTFVIFCNSEELFHFSYRRYIENCLRDAYGFDGTPIRLVIKQKGDNNE